jgi:hypothetical protein
MDINHSSQPSHDSLYFVSQRTIMATQNNNAKMGDDLLNYSQISADYNDVH